MVTITINGDGACGANGIDGLKGKDGFYAGSDGAQGGDATPPNNGSNGDRILLCLDRNADNLVTITLPNSDEPCLEDIYLGDLDLVRITARGGNGGNGAFGGDGGDGAKGKKGKNANEYRFGGRGGRGGDGGRGGFGTNGANGGAGGIIDVQIQTRDTFALMAIEKCDQNSSSLVIGGSGGIKGRHGKGGRGGKGGPGGDSYSWTKTKYIDRRTGAKTRSWDTNSNKRVEHHYNPGGSRGPAGSDGYSPCTALYDGNNGNNGVFSITIVDGPSGPQSFSSRYDLQLDGLTFQSIGTFDEGVFEFGEIAMVSSLKVQNIGGMSTPKMQRVLFRLEKTDKSVSPFIEDENFMEIGDDLEPGEVETFFGSLRFSIGHRVFPPSLSDFEPFQCTSCILVNAVQLGPETNDRCGSLTVFQRLYGDFHTTSDHPILLKYPVENQVGIVGLRSLAPGEATGIEFTITNVSNKILGACANTSFPRYLGVQFFLAGGDIPEKDIHFCNSDGQEVDIGTDCTSDETLYKGYFVQILDLDPSHSFATRQSVYFSPSIASYSRAVLQAEIILQAPPTLNAVGEAESQNELHVIQRRNIEIVSEPAFRNAPGARAVIICSTATAKKQYTSWMRLFQQFGIVVDSYSVSRYGHIDAHKTLPSDMPLGQAFANKLVVVLNEAYNPIRRDDLSIRPSHILPHGCGQGSGFAQTTKWLVVGSNNDTTEELLRSLPMTEPAIGSKPFDCVKDFKKMVSRAIKEERASGKIKEDSVKMKCFRIFLSHSSIWPLNELRAMKKAAKVAQLLKKWLVTTDKLRHYVVEYRVCISPEHQTISKGILLKRRIFGEIDVHCGLNRMKSLTAVVNFSESLSLQLSSEKVICSAEMYFAVASALPPPLRIEVLCNCIKSICSSPKSTTQKIVLDCLMNAIACDCLWDIDNILVGKLHLQKDERINFPSVSLLMSNRHIQILISQGQDDSKLRACLCQGLSGLLSRLLCIACSKDMHPVWPSRRRGVQRKFRRLVDALKDEWFSILDESGVEKNKERINDAVHSHIKERGKFFTGLHRRWRKGLFYVFSSNNSATVVPEQEENSSRDDLKHFSVKRLVQFDSSSVRKKESTRFEPCTSKVLSPANRCLMSHSEAERARNCQRIFQETNKSRNELLWEF